MNYLTLRSGLAGSLGFYFGFFLILYHRQNSQRFLCFQGEIYYFGLSKTLEHKSITTPGLYDGATCILLLRLQLILIIIILSLYKEQKITLFFLMPLPLNILFQSSYWFQKQFSLGLWWAHSRLWGVRKHWDACQSEMVMSSSEECCSQEAGIQLMNVSKSNRGSRLPKRNRKYALLQHFLGLWLTSDLAPLESSDPYCRYQL